MTAKTILSHIWRKVFYSSNTPAMNSTSRLCSIRLEPAIFARWQGRLSTSTSKNGSGLLVASLFFDWRKYGSVHPIRQLHNQILTDLEMDVRTQKQFGATNRSDTSMLLYCAPGTVSSASTFLCDLFGRFLSVAVPHSAPMLYIPPLCFQGNAWGTPKGAL
ncbi:hypothetical protein BDR03DRAFT_955291 [Suillus americanus]|nr:hypothetical protein BDR03DRAFT_955291 [Suillus americanus]